MEVKVAVRLRKSWKIWSASSLWDLRMRLTSLEFSLISPSADGGVFGDRRWNH
jgi:hypothetical protein